MTYSKLQSKLVGEPKVGLSIPVSQGGFCLATPPTLALVCFQMLFLFFFSSSLPASLKRAFRIAHNAQLSFLTNTLMAQHCLLAAISARVGGKCTSGNSLARHRVLGPLPGGHHKPDNHQAREMAHLGFWFRLGCPSFPILGGLCSSPRVAVLSFTETGGASVFPTLPVL